jgi:hypothetical protein
VEKSRGWISVKGPGGVGVRTSMGHGPSSPLPKIPAPQRQVTLSTLQRPAKRLPGHLPICIELWRNVELSVGLGKAYASILCHADTSESDRHMSAPDCGIRNRCLDEMELGYLILTAPQLLSVPNWLQASTAPAYRYSSGGQTNNRVLAMACPRSCNVPFMW